MLQTRKIKLLLILVFASAFTFVSCSDEDEMIEQQEPQSQISDDLKSKLIENLEENQINEEFQSKINWPQTTSSTNSYCGIDIALLAYEVFDANNNSLNVTNVVPWISGQGQTFQDIVNEVEQNFAQEFGEPVQAIFVAGLLVNTIDQNSYEVAEISNYATFSDFFNDCQSPDVIFEVSQDDTFDFNIPMPNSDDVNFPNVPEPCATLDFPLDIVVADEANPSVTFQESVDEIELSNYLQGNVTGYVFIEFVYPVSITLNDGTQVFANNASELQTILNQDCN